MRKIQIAKGAPSSPWESTSNNRSSAPQRTPESRENAATTTTMNRSSKRFQLDTPAAA
jgi:hypothetical protein